MLAQFDETPDSLSTARGCKVEAALLDLPVGGFCQFERLGYYCVDEDSSADMPVFNKTVGLRDTWAKLQKRK